MNEYPQLLVPDLSPDELDQLLKISPALKEHIKAEPSASSEDREAGLLAVVITLAPGVLSVAAALLNFLAARAKKK